MDRASPVTCARRRIAKGLPVDQTTVVMCVVAIAATRMGGGWGVSSTAAPTPPSRGGLVVFGSREIGHGWGNSVGGGKWTITNRGSGGVGKGGGRGVDIVRQGRIEVQGVERQPRGCF